MILEKLRENNIGVMHICNTSVQSLKNVIGDLSTKNGLSL